MDYWNDPRFDSKKPGRSSGLPDNIYRPAPHGLERVPNDTHSLKNMAKDIRGLNSLVFQNVWYFGFAAPILPERFVLRMPENARRGHRRCEIDGPAWNDLEQWLNEAQAPSCVTPVPIADGG
jgi:hypothetical protein